MLQEQREMGLPISTLYPATTAFYRRAGYERAAQRIIYEVPLSMMNLRDYTLEALPVGPDQYDILKYAGKMLDGFFIESIMHFRAVERNRGDAPDDIKHDNL